MNEVWYKSDGTTILISEMTNDHLFNAIRKFKEMTEVDGAKPRAWKGKTHKQWLDLLAIEQDRRASEAKQPRLENKFEAEYRWAVDHPNDRDAEAFLALPWWSEIDPIEVAVLAGSIQEKMKKKKITAQLDSRCRMVERLVRNTERSRRPSDHDLSSNVSKTVGGSKMLDFINCFIPPSRGKVRIPDTSKYLLIQRWRISPNPVSLTGDFSEALDVFIYYKIIRSLVGIKTNDTDFSNYDTLIKPRGLPTPSMLRNIRAIQLPIPNFLLIDSSNKGFIFALHSFEIDDLGLYAWCGWNDVGKSNSYRRLRF